MQFRVIVVTDPPTHSQDRLQFTVLQLACSVKTRTSEFNVADSHVQGLGRGY